MQLITRADDSGSSFSANRAVVECFDHGLLRNTSVMACGDAIKDAAEKFVPRPGLCIGLHVTLTSEWYKPRYRPVLPPSHVPTLVDEQGYFHPMPSYLNVRGFDPDEALAVGVAQHTRLCQVGLRPAYLDEHMGVGWLPRLSERLTTFANREGLILASSHAPTLPSFEAHSFIDPDRVASVISRLDAVQCGRFVLITHPLHSDDNETHFITNGEHPPGYVAHERIKDRLLLTSKRFEQYLTSRKIRLVRYDDDLV